MTEKGQHERVQAWRHALGVWVAALLLFETLTGLSIWLLPFGVANQMAVLAHTVLGIVLLVPCARYLARHWTAYCRTRMSHVVLTGYLASAAVLVALLSGGVLTWQALAGARISYAWDGLHIAATVGVLASVLFHLLVPVLAARRRRPAPAALSLLAAQRRYGLDTAGACGILVGLVIAGAWTHRPVELATELPRDYSFVYGAERPFAPSLATTTTGSAFDPRALGGSASCGTARCHAQIVEEWRTSAHRYAAMDPGFRAVQAAMGEQNGPESTRYCAGCHDPISLFAGTKNLFRDELTNPVGLDEGVSCIACHAIREVDIKGNASYVIDQPPRYLFELEEGRAARFVTDFLIRAYPRHHVDSLSHRLFKSPEFCAACHKQFIDEEINQVGWVQLQNQYDNWRTSRWNHPGEPARTIECRECHMPLVESLDPARGDTLDYNRSDSDLRHRNHRFLGANQFVPSLLGLPGAEEHERLVASWLRGEIRIPEIEDKWRTGPAVPVEIVAPPRVAPGEQPRLAVVITNNKAGHDFPTGPLDIIQAWLELTATDQQGNVLYVSGSRDDAGFIQEGSFIFKAEPVDQSGNLIDRHNLWEMVGVRYRRAVYPGLTDRAEFVLPAPPQGVDEVRVTVRLLYRKFDQFLLNYMFGEQSAVTAPVTALAEDEAIIRVEEVRDPRFPVASHVVTGS